MRILLIRMRDTWNGVPADTEESSLDQLNPTRIVRPAKINRVTWSILAEPCRLLKNKWLIMKNIFSCAYLLSVLVKCLFVCFVCVQIGLFAFLLLNFKSSWYILDTHPWSGIWFSHISLPLCTLSGYLNKVFHRTNVLNFDVVQWISFTFYGSCVGCQG